MMYLLSRDATLADWLMALAIMGFLVGLFAMGPWS
jgi:hypothetical protein